MTSRGLLFVASLSALPSFACGGGSGETPNTGNTTEATTEDPGVSTTTPTPTTSSDTTVDDSGPTPTTEDSAPLPDYAPSGGMCNLFLQDCNPSEKCTAWSMDGSLFPNGTKCVPETGDRLPGEDCALEGDFGEGIDNCAAGSLCLDIDNSGQASCVAYCSGDMQSPSCPEPEDKCAFLFEPTVPLCFPACDPLAQNCPESDACVPNLAALGSEYFVCMPLVFQEIPGQYGNACYAISGCDKGFQCIFAENVPMCEGDVYCCSAWCDIEMPETCKQFDPTIDCVPWYEEGAATPGYENVGICGIMP